MSAPPPEVLDLFAVPGAVAPLPGGRGPSVRAGDLVLSPGRDERVQVWLSPLLARLGVALDEDPARRAGDVRVAVPVPARDGSWVVEGWAASRYEEGTTTCHDLAVTLAAGRVLHSRLDGLVRARPAALDERDDHRARAERLAFGPAADRRSAAAGTAAADVVRRLEPHLRGTSLGPDQLVHAGLAGNVLLDRDGAPVVIDVSPAWRPASWAEALAVLDFVVWSGAPSSALEAWTTGRERQALLRALLFRVFADDPVDPVDPVDPGAYAPVLGALGVSAVSGGGAPST